jgi:hypothetical protein
VSFSRLSTGTKLASKTPKKIQKSVLFRFSTGTKSSKTAQKIFLKMNRWKSSLTCSNCSKIFQDPIELPCKSQFVPRAFDLRKKLSNRKKSNAVNVNRNFEVKDNDFKPNEILKKQLDELVYLSDEEFALKKQIEDSIRQFFQMYEQFTLNKTTLDLDVHESFPRDSI